MKRETKFRGKRIDTGEWVHGDLVINRPSQDFKIITDGIIVKHGDYTDDRWQGFVGYVCNVDKSTVGQFTGLKDKKGIDIYEGDIIRFCDDPPYCSDYIVKYDDERLIWIASGAVGDYMDDLWELGCGDFVRVIGNIYDNPEML